MERKTLARVLHTTESTVIGLAVLLMGVIPVVELVGRQLFGSGIPGANDYLQHLTLWVGFLGAMFATRTDKHLRIGSITDGFAPKIRHGLSLFAALVASGVCAALCWASLHLVSAEAPALPEAWREHCPALLLQCADYLCLFDPGSTDKVGLLIPAWVAMAIMPIGFAVMAVRFVLRADKRWSRRGIVALGIPAAALMGCCLGDHAVSLRIPGIVIMIGAGLCGAPIFVMLGGIAVLLFYADGVTVAAIPAESYRIVTSPVFPTIPLFTLVGFILSESRASERLQKVFDAWWGWLPGGAAVAVALMCAFFTTFTGASGVTILALGGLLLPVLLESGYPRRFSVGLLTATGSLGLLLPPSLVVILYGVMAHVPITDMFKAGLLPGVLMIVPVAIACVWQGKRVGVERRPFRIREALSALRHAAWEVLIPVFALVMIFSGLCTLVEAAAITAVYALFVEVVVYRDLSLRKLGQVVVRCGVLVGGILIVLGVAMGLTSYLVDAQVPTKAAAWVKLHIHAKWLFLLAVNGALILVGCFMDIFSALVVVVPLLLPMAQAFDVDPVHLGIIFLANLQVGYLTPPIGMNLFLASFRFEQPLMRVARSALPFLFLMLAVVLLVTYVPWLTLGVLALLK